jgi:asparagine synthase (glutamine-hydrolysing)
MSGIAGYINNVEKTPNALLDSMSESIKFTENDCIDKWSDDFLAISRVHHGVINSELQPIYNEDKSLLIVMDGEVFDYEEQKLKLIHNGHKFKFKNNDAEYCLHLYEEMQEKAFKELNGSFCFAIYNLATHELLLVSDRFSSYSLFYYLTDKGTLLFGTQLSSIVQSFEVPRELDIRSIFEFFTFQRVLGKKTFYKDINVLPSATVLGYWEGNISLNSYWERRYKEEKHSEKYYVDKLAEAIKKSVERRTRGNHRFGILLSGGLDSRTVLAASDKKMVCFTVGDFRNREVKIAKRITKTKGCKHVFLKRELDHYENLVDKAVEIGDGMQSFAHAHFIGLFAQIQKKCDILFHSFGNEGYFRGTHLPRRSVKLFGKSFFKVLNKLSNENLPYKIIEKLKYSLYPKNPQQLFSKSYLSILDSVLLSSVSNILTETESACPNIYDKFLWFDTHYISRYPSFLFEKSIRSFIDERIILFDNDLQDLHLKMPLNIRSNSKIWKKALVKLDPKIAVILNANTGYSPLISEFLEWGLTLSRRAINKVHSLKFYKVPHPTYTQGAWPNFTKLIRYNERMRKLISNTLRDSECLNPKIFNIQRIEEMFEEHLNGKTDYTEFLFLLLTFGRWHKKYGAKSSGSV